MGQSHTGDRREAGLKSPMANPSVRILECGNLEEVRAEIDCLDREIVKLLAQRGKYVLQAARFKPTKSDIYAPARVEQVVANVRKYAIEYDASADVVENGYRVLIAGFTEQEFEAHGASET